MEKFFDVGMSRPRWMMLGTTTVSGVSFYDWVREVAEESNAKVAAKIGIDPSTVGGWQIRDPKVRDVVNFAKAYQRSIPEALRNAYGLTAEELGQAEMDPRTLSDADLLVQLVTRMHVDPEQLYQALGGGQAVFQSDRKSREAHARPRR